MTYTVIIPLRAGSKRIPWKNTKLLNWKPLFLYTLDSALKVDDIKNIVITTDDIKVIDILNLNYKRYLDTWKIIIINRDKKLSWDNASSIDVILDIIEKIKDIDNIILLQATSPLRNEIDIKKSINIFEENSKENISLVSIKEVYESPYWQYKINNNWKLENLFDKKYLKYRSQDLSKTYIPNWAIFIKSKELLKKELSFYWNNIIPYIMNVNKSIDIDELFDFEYCEFLLNKIN